MSELGQKIKVFLCHAPADVKLVRNLYRYLDKVDGVSLWLADENLIPGQDWQTEIQKALHESDVVIVCLTKKSTSREGEYQKEIKFAINRAKEIPDGGIFLIPVKLEACEVPFELQLHYSADFFTPEGRTKIIKAIRERAIHLHRADVAEFSKLPEADIFAWDSGKVKKSHGENDRKSGSKPKLKPETKPEAKPESKLVRQNIPTALIVTGVFGAIFCAALVFFFLARNLFPLLTPVSASTGVPATEMVSVEPATSEPVSSTELITPSTELVDGYGVPMVLIPSGDFVMGSDSGSADEKPARTVGLGSFYIDKYEVTNAQYKACEDAGGCQLPPKNITYYSDPSYADYPVVYVDWNMAHSYCTWRGMSLPTEAQWEKSARGDGPETTYPWKDSLTCARIDVYQKNEKYCIKEIARVGSDKNNRSPYGVYDLMGNAWEWVRDRYSEYYYESAPKSNPLGPEIGELRVVRGGLTFGLKGFASASNRGKYLQGDYFQFLGLRCSMDAP